MPAGCFCCTSDLPAPLEDRCCKACYQCQGAFPAAFQIASFSAPFDGPYATELNGMTFPDMTWSPVGKRPRYIASFNLFGRGYTETVDMELTCKSYGVAVDPGPPPNCGSTLASYWTLTFTFLVTGTVITWIIGDGWTCGTTLVTMNLKTATSTADVPTPPSTCVVSGVAPFTNSLPNPLPTKLYLHWDHIVVAVGNEACTPSLPNPIELDGDGITALYDSGCISMGTDSSLPGTCYTRIQCACIDALPIPSPPADGGNRWILTGPCGDENDATACQCNPIQLSFDQVDITGTSNADCGIDVGQCCGAVGCPGSVTLVGCVVTE